MTTFSDMLKLIYPLMACIWMTSASADEAPPPADIAALASQQNVALDSGQMEKDLQSLSWEHFRSVVESVPKLKADVDAYGPFGWQYVKGNYRTYGWKKNIDRLDASQKQHLAALIQDAKAAR